MDVDEVSLITKPLCSALTPEQAADAAADRAVRRAPVAPVSWIAVAPVARPAPAAPLAAPFVPAVAPVAVAPDFRPWGRIGEGWTRKGEARPLAPATAPAPTEPCTFDGERGSCLVPGCARCRALNERAVKCQQWHLDCGSLSAARRPVAGGTGRRLGNVPEGREPALKLTGTARDPSNRAPRAWYGAAIMA